MVSHPQLSMTNIKNIVLSVFGPSPRNGLIASRLTHYYQKSPAVWADEVDTILQLLCPDSPLFSSSLGILAIAEYVVKIEVVLD